MALLCQQDCRGSQPSVECSWPARCCQQRQVWRAKQACHDVCVLTCDETGEWGPVQQMLCCCACKQPESVIAEIRHISYACLWCGCHQPCTM